MRLVSITFILCCLLLSVQSQTECIPVFVKEYTFSGDLHPLAIKKTTDGNYIVAGRMTIGSNTDYKAMMTKITSDGSVIWSGYLDAFDISYFEGVLPLSNGDIAFFGINEAADHSIQNNSLWRSAFYD